MTTCRLCQQNAVSELLDFGAQPLCNRFLRTAQEPQYTHPLAVGQCSQCGVVQLLDPPPSTELRPRVDWISYNEPESHLDAVADRIRALPGLTEHSVICGVSYKDATTLRRLRDRGLPHTWCLDPAADLNISELGAGVETIQGRLAPSAERVARAHGRADVVIARHILEHAHDLPGFFRGLTQLLKPQGYLVVELPDCRRALAECDYSSVWEEHVFYFTPQTFRDAFAFGGYRLVQFDSYPYALENSLVGIAQPDHPLRPAAAPELGLGHTLRDNFAPARARLNSVLRRQPGKIAFLGAGHLSCVFINLFGLADRIEFVVDDNPHKQGLFMPGSRLPIRGSAALVEADIQLCLLCLSPETEGKVIGKNQPFLQRGGRFASIFSGSPYALQTA